MIDNAVFQDPKASELARLRIDARAKRRLVYDCVNAKVKGHRVLCSKGHVFLSPGPRQAKGMALLTVLTGRTSLVCQGCNDYDKEVTE